MPSVIELALAGEPMQVHADRALFWPARRRLLIADLHLGKGSVMRAAGIAVPSGGTGQDLERLDRLLHTTLARELWVLGDFLHGARQPAAEAAWRGLLAAHPRVRAGVVAGNHDRALAAGALGIDRLPDDVHDGPFRFRHHPRDRQTSAPGFVVCGHLHPVVRLPGLPGRYPAFAVTGTQCVLPAFSRFTGGHPIDQEAVRWIACAGGELLVRPG